MFIRRTQTRSAEGGKVYHSYRLVRSERSGERVRQRTLLNLGSDFAVATEHWAVLCSRIEQLLERQEVLVELDCPEEVEREAQRIALQLVHRGPEVAAGGTDLQTVDVESLELERPRTVGVTATARGRPLNPRPSSNLPSVVSHKYAYETAGPFGRRLRCSSSRGARHTGGFETRPYKSSRLADDQNALASS